MGVTPRAATKTTEIPDRHGSAILWEWQFYGSGNFMGVTPRAATKTTEINRRSAQEGYTHRTNAAFRDKRTCGA